MKIKVCFPKLFGKTLPKMLHSVAFYKNRLQKAVLHCREMFWIWAWTLNKFLQNNCAKQLLSMADSTLPKVNLSFLKFLSEILLKSDADICKCDIIIQTKARLVLLWKWFFQTLQKIFENRAPNIAFKDVTHASLCYRFWKSGSGK